MAKKYYVVWQGRETGIFTDWASCKAQVYEFRGAKYKSYLSRAEAEEALRSGRTASTPSKRPSVTSAATNKTSTTLSADDVAAVAVQTKVFTDGGCEPNPGNAGSGVALYRDEQLAELWFGLYNPQGTNNTAELNALHQAMLMAQRELDAQRSVAIFCDSKYSIQCITQWAAGWQRNNWTKRGGEIKNLDLIKPMFELFQSLQNNVQILHVNGHVGVQGNELADRMSIMAMESKQTDFVQYPEPFDLAALLAMRSG